MLISMVKTTIMKLINTDCSVSASRIDVNITVNIKPKRFVRVPNIQPE